MPKMLSFLPTSHRSVILSLACLATLWSAPAWSEKSDRAQPLTFAADAARVEDNQRLNILTGNVEITKGSMVVRSDRVEVRQNADGTQTATAIGGNEGRAYFRQKREGVDEAIEGEAERVIYEGKDDTVRFIGRAVMRRLKGVAVSDEVTGQTIVYDNKTSVFQVVGNSGGTTTTKGRVRGVISPRQSEPAAAAPKDKASLTPSSTITPVEGR
ncbi:MAG: lipopolysaccharide transport periplasmic protein LptA [Aquabacterium sp.]